ncbi:nitrate- and nitrite sensing domain-containing protein [Actinomadura sp. HBU206391]|uniref:sensor histidine kinase n=1 Tax=Actinomadura sp. HBU206391 TaxID=2731692 RepID=UPI0021C576AD|nr:nitrate- and nitrite sensing domain-containing protein [Actinomadura sp. HBU206391]
MLASLFALWAFAAWVTLHEGLNLLWVGTIDSKVTRPGVTLVTELQKERRLSLIYLGSRGRQRGGDLAAQRSNTDKVLAEFRKSASGGDVSTAADSVLEQRIQDALGRLGGLAPGRQAIDAARVDRAQGSRTFDDIIDAVFRIYNSTTGLSDEGIAKDTRTLIRLTRAKELLSREDALLAGVLARGRFLSGEHPEFVQLIGAQRLMHAEAVAELPVTGRARYEQVARSEAFTRFRAFEDRVMESGRAGARPPFSAAQWQAAVEPVQTQLEKVVLAGGDDIVKRATPGAVWVIIRLFLAGGLGLVAVIASIVVSIATARALVRQLEKLRDAARELSESRLPGVVERLGRGEDVDVAAEAPALEFGADEVGQVGQAFNAVQQTAIKVAVEQAELRRGIRDILLSLARRSQTLVRRQLSLLDVMERRELDPTELEDLFRVDHLATRMRRNAENLIVLSGATPARGWRRSVPMVDVLRAAVAEVEDYARVNVLPVGGVTLAGRAVGDVTHLLAELIENAVSFSPSYTVVQVGGHMAASGYAVEIEDRGLGMSEEALQAANEQIVSSPEFNLSSTARLGLYVVSRLADRYGIRVSLKRSAYGGTTAIVLIPREFVIAEGEIDPLFEETSGPATEGESGAVREDRAEAMRMVGVGTSAGAGDAGAHRAASIGGRGTATTLDPGPVVVDPSDQGAFSRWADDSSTIVSADMGDRADAAGLPHDHGRPEALREPDGRERPGAAEGLAEPEQAEKPDKPEAAEAKLAETAYTPSGLPFRVPQASLAPPLRSDEPRTAAEQRDDEDVPRSPEEVRKVMGAYQAGTRRGRSDAARSASGGPHPETPPDALDGE